MALSSDEQGVTITIPPACIVSASIQDTARFFFPCRGLLVLTHF